MTTTTAESLLYKLIMASCRSLVTNFTHTSHNYEGYVKQCHQHAQCTVYVY